jgi:hypothetical protein
LIPRLKQQLLAALDQAGIGNVADALGARADILAEQS